jgi:hypothetical protein
MSLRIDAKIIVKGFPLLEWVNSKCSQESVELFRKYFAPLGGEVLTRNACTTVSARYPSDQAKRTQIPIPQRFRGPERVWVGWTVSEAREAFVTTLPRMSGSTGRVRRLII